MDRFRVPMMAEYSGYEKQKGPFETKYGLPEQVKFCRQCVISNQRPTSTVEYKHRSGSRKETIHFDDEGICAACRFAQKKRHEIDWEEREAVWPCWRPCWIGDRR